MQEKDINANRSEEKILQELGFETVDLVIEHELRGVTPEMLDWWWINMVNSQYYLLWHPIFLRFPATPASQLSFPFYLYL